MSKLSPEAQKTFAKAQPGDTIRGVLQLSNTGVKELFPRLSSIKNIAKNIEQKMNIKVERVMTEVNGPGYLSVEVPVSQLKDLDASSRVECFTTFEEAPWKDLKHSTGPQTL